MSPAEGLPPRVEIRAAESPADVTAVRDLMREYQESLGIDLSFQDFERELRDLPGDYGPPDGLLLLALVDGAPAGCVGVRRWDATRAEMKRLFLRPGGRGLGLGRSLAERAIAAAAHRGYRQMLLDTLPAMAAAQALYRALGFSDTAPYRANPVPGASFLKLDLAVRR